MRTPALAFSAATLLVICLPVGRRPGDNQGQADPQPRSTGAARLKRMGGTIRHPT